MTVWDTIALLRTPESSFLQARHFKVAIILTVTVSSLTTISVDTSNINSEANSVAIILKVWRGGGCGGGDVVGSLGRCLTSTRSGLSLAATEIRTTWDAAFQRGTPERLLFSAVHLEVSIILAITVIRQATFSVETTLNSTQTEFITVRQ